MVPRFPPLSRTVPYSCYYLHVNLQRCLLYVCTSMSTLPIWMVMYSSVWCMFCIFMHVHITVAPIGSVLYFCSLCLYEHRWEIIAVSTVGTSLLHKSQLRLHICRVTVHWQYYLIEKTITFCKHALKVLQSVHTFTEIFIVAFFTGTSEENV